MHTHPNAKVGNVAERIAEHLDAIRGYFKPGTVLTLVVRGGGGDAVDHRRDMILTSDRIPRVVEALLHHQMAADTVRGSVEAE